MSTFLADASMWLVISAAGSILVGVLFLHLFRHYAGAMTRLTIASQARVRFAFFSKSQTVLLNVQLS